MKTKEIKKMLKKHEMWVCGEEGGERADFSYKNLIGANLEGANLIRASLYGADLTGAILIGANLEGALLYEVNLTGANLTGANLRWAHLDDTNLTGANLEGADIRGANLFRANSKNIKTNEATKGFHLRCPSKGAFEAWKACRNNVLVKLLIPKDAKRSSATTNKCRCDRAIVLDVLGGEVGVSQKKESFLYKKGETVRTKYFCKDRWQEYAMGIHFFMTKEEAESWL